MLIVHNGKVITEEAIEENKAVVIEGDFIQTIIPEADIGNYPEAALMNANGGYVSPGFIDIHSDYIETIVSPRPTTMMDMHFGLREAEKILIDNGITTMFHSLSFYREDAINHKPMRTPENVQKLVDAIEDTHHNMHLIRHRLHARFEIDNLDQIPVLENNIQAGKVHLLSFMDHTPGQGQYRDLEMYRKTLKGYRDLSDSDVNVIIKERQDVERMTIDKMKEVGELALRHNIALASHDDDRETKVDLVKSFGTTISEFPVSLAIAAKAKQEGLQTIVGAPNVLMGGSHSGNLSAADAVNSDAADILCSDYYPAAMLHAVFELGETYGNNLHDMFMMVTKNPAQAVHMDDEIGSIQAGKKADLLVIERMEDGFPIITKTIVNGRIMTTTNYRTD